jgi:GAF domain-containing protein
MLHLREINLKLKVLLKRYSIQISLIIVLLIVLINSAFIIIDRRSMVRIMAEQEDLIALIARVERIDQNIKLAEIGIRAYLIKQEPQYIRPYLSAASFYNKNLLELSTHLEQSKIETSGIEMAFEAVRDYMDDLALIYALSNSDRLNEAIAIFAEDRGAEAFQRYNPFVNEVRDIIAARRAENDIRFDKATLNVLINQIILLVFSVPVLIAVFRRIRRNHASRKALFGKLQDSKNKYVFDSGQRNAVENEHAIIDDMIGSLSQASKYISELAKGRYDMDWDGMNEANRKLNGSNIAAELINMRNQMKRVKEENDRRLWSTEGISSFSDIIRKHQNDFKGMSEQIISSLVKYVKVEQGGLFIVNTNAQGSKHLELMASFAYNRKKHLEKQIEPGQGLVGQCYLERDTIVITNAPEEFVQITSGLGGAHPKNVLIVPLKSNDAIEGVIELAAIKPFEPHVIEFVETLCESIAAAIETVKSNAITRELLETSQQQAEEMRAQEEEMRQNMEELQATQEQMHRKNEEVETRLKEAASREASLSAELTTLKQQLEATAT